MNRRLLLWGLVLAAGLIVLLRFREIRDLAGILARGRWEWILAAVLLTFVFSLVRTYLYHLAFVVVGVRSRVSDLLPVYFASLFANLVMPVAGAGGTAVFADDAARRGESGARATLGGILVMTVEFVAFLFLLVGGLFVLRQRGALQIYQLVAAAIFVVFAVWFVAVLLLGVWSPRSLRRLLGWLQKVINRLSDRFRRGEALPPGWAESQAGSLIAAAEAITARPIQVAATLGLALLVHLINLGILSLLFLAFRQRPEVGTLLAGYSMGMLFWYVAIVPQGIGAVEGAIALVLISLGLAAEPAALLGLGFRGLIFWMPLAIGFFMLRRLKSFGAAASEEGAPIGEPSS